MARPGPVVHANIDLSGWTAALRAGWQLAEAIEKLSDELAHVVPSALADGFGEFMDDIAKQDSEYLWHVYNYGFVGDRNNRLFRLTPIKSVASNSLEAKVGLQVHWQMATEPIGRPDPFHNYPNDRRGAQHIFRWQAPVLESEENKPMGFMADKMVFWGVDEETGEETWIVAKRVETYQDGGQTIGQFSEQFYDYFVDIYHQLGVPAIQHTLEREFVRTFRTASVRKLGLEQRHITTESGVSGRLAIEHTDRGETLVLITDSGAPSQKFGRGNIRVFAEGVGGTQRAKELARAVAAELREMM